jgi:hypothetical protein
MKRHKQTTSQQTKGNNMIVESTIKNTLMANNDILDGDDLYAISVEEMAHQHKMLTVYEVLDFHKIRSTKERLEKKLQQLNKLTGDIKRELAELEQIKDVFCY